MQLSNDEIRRYSRHLILPEVGLPGQKKICSTSVLCIGAGLAAATRVVRVVCLTVRVVVFADVSLVAGAVALVSVVVAGWSATG
jgi:molybdopterin/thiamine biosynthesis adenylyltransferase